MTDRLAMHDADDRAQDSGCCGPSRPEQEGTAPGRAFTPAPGTQEADDLLLLSGGSFLMGTNDRGGYPADGEGPVRRITLNPFLIDIVAVSNEKFARFVDATGYVTE